MILICNSIGTLPIDNIILCFVLILKIKVSGYRVPNRYKI